ncbi:hypothetical protein ACLMJK_000868 [Lecanora helva]
MAPAPVSDDRALHFLAEEGYLPIALADHPGMLDAYIELFAQSQKYFDLPADSDQKTRYQAVSGPAASEEGYSKIPGEKCILTTRTSNRCPPILQKQLEATWSVTGTFMQNIMAAIANTLHLKGNPFEPFVAPCATLTDKKTSTQLRMFRYDRPTGEEPTVNAEMHKDLGLLSLVIGHSPGLQVLDSSGSTWISIEEPPALPPHAAARSNGLTATLLGGQTLSFLTRNNYKAGVHRVVCAPASVAKDPYRFSVVFTLRPAIAPLYTKDFESDVVGKFEEGERMEGGSSGVLFDRIMKSHWNVNAAKDVRERQREEQRKRREAEIEDMNATNGIVSKDEVTKPASG